MSYYQQYPGAGGGGFQNQQQQPYGNQQQQFCGSGPAGPNYAQQTQNFAAQGYPPNNAPPDIQEFSALYKYITDWKACFDNFDQDRSGTISSNELHIALANFGYNLSPQFAQLCVRKFEKQNKIGTFTAGNINFDDFIHCCVTLHKLTEAFKKKDTQLTGVIQLKYEDFLELVFENALLHSK